MKHSEFIEKMMEDVCALPIEQVLADDGMTFKRSGSNFFGQSPFRDSTSTSSFSVCTRRNIFMDWTLGIGGNAIKYTSLKRKLSYLEAAYWLAFRYGIVSKEQYEKGLRRKARTEELSQFFEKRHQSIAIGSAKNRAEAQTLDQVYRLFLSFAPLSDNHRAHLMSKERDLSLEAIEAAGFFTFPGRIINRKFLKAIQELFGSEDVLSNVPGFYRRVGEKHFTFMSFKGIGIPVRDENGYIVALQIRKDVKKTEDESRYIWFSSSFAEDDPDNKNELGTGSGAPIDVTYPKKLKTSTAFITEGKFKSLAIASLYDSIALSAQGISSGKKALPILKALRETHRLKVDTLIIAYDADLFYNMSVLRSAIDLSQKAIQQGFKTYFLLWDPAIGKGIDDCIHAGGTVCRMDALLFLRVIEKYTRFVLEKEGMLDVAQPLDYEQGMRLVSTLKKDVLKHYYPFLFKGLKLENLLKSPE